MISNILKRGFVVLVLSSMVLPCLAPAADLKADMEAIVQKKLDQVNQDLTTLNETQSKLDALKTEIEAAKTSRRRSLYVGIPLAAVGIFAAYHGFTEGFRASSFPVIGDFLNGVAKLVGVGGSALALGSGTYVFVKIAKVYEIEDTIAETQKALSKYQTQLESDRAELETLKQASQGR
jgi:prefoldin subunit 5